MDDSKKEINKNITDRYNSHVPFGIRITADWAWRIIVITACLAVMVFLFAQIKVVIIPLLVALMLTALLSPAQRKLESIGIPKSISTLISLLALVTGIGALTTLIITQFASGFDDFKEKAISSYDELDVYLKNLPFEIKEEDVAKQINILLKNLEENQNVLFNGAVSVTLTLTAIITGALLAIFALIFFLLDRREIWQWSLKLSPKNIRKAVDGSGKVAWSALGQYARVQMLVAFIDSLGIGIGAAILGLPFVIPISILVFLGSFIPFVGATVSGFVAVLIALVYKGPIWALIMLAIVILVQLIEGHLLQPFITGNAVRLHPLAVILAVSIGTLVAGLPGALFAVPIVASVSAVSRYLSSKEWEDNNKINNFEIKE